MARITGRQALERRLNLADLTVLVLAMAVGLLATRHDLEGLFSRPQDLEGGQVVYRWTLPVALSKAVTVEVWLMAWTAGWLILQLRPPRLRLRHLSHQPGFLACFSAVVISLVSGPLTWAIIRSHTSGTNAWLDHIVWGESVSSQIGASVLAGWALLLASGRCRSRAGWLDRVGQVLGVIWVAMIPANLAHFFWHSGWSN
jgi:hypothetical protein